jgi:hypothetical protein
MVLLIAYRGCNDRRKASIRLFAAKLESLDAPQISNVIYFKPRQV